MKALASIATFSFLIAACGSSGSPDAVCKHLQKIGDEQTGDKEADADGMKRCVEEMKKIKAEFGGEVWGKVSACAMKAKNLEDLKGCDPEKFGASKESGGASAAKQTEAVQFLKKLSDGARAYYLDGSNSASLTPTPPQFPDPSAGPTPALGECCKQGGKCAPEAPAWSKPTWVALQFSVDDPHYYSYEYKVSPDKKSFTVSAYGDLDCDGEYSTFSMTGAATADGPGATGAVTKTKPAE